MKYLLDDSVEYNAPDKPKQSFQENEYNSTYSPYEIAVADSSNESQTIPIYIGPIMISDDVDDQQILGMKRRRQKKARTNTR